MRRRGWLGLLLAMAVTAGTTTGCVTISPIAATGDFPVAAGVRLDNSPTFQRMAQRDQGRGRIVIGVKNDQPGLGYYDESTKTYTGFDVEIAQLVAARLGFGRARIQFVPITSANRENALQNGSVDLVVASYSYSPDRAQNVSFAGPYFQTDEGLLVRSDESGVTGVTSFTAGDTVCSTSGSTSFTPLASLTRAQPVSRGSFSECVAALKDHSVSGVYTDLAVLAGYALQDPAHLRLIAVPQAGDTQLYGIGLPYGDDLLRRKIDDILVAAEKDGTWQAIFNATLAPSGIEAITPRDGVWMTRS
ncbi:glutamate ABC transporter substrate-binding protein [Actinocrinis puniceicyclus]|uniref:Glutamate ABC transporter substrate-binding protein n=1 Tax=Actinocrinis puniceicyclus TaxID=977794 RepID=A0A8J7WRE7_9ACTN|nr:glutamate ABC transporter substrate-binding protein [Actinocrinis puniceicyclus]MBS2964024.1 glutamate ABC transporter substrate-binding protein [Actinocrinis puniceicyclus]